ncbi:sphingoid long-chain bases kinase 1-like [Miscanthus floridulus]|uniref:sphingoid long-chain bases kinase 1-like n=1 Tax=Miscanthus floridulus TaxID=154761 RepID=UPI0034586280
MSSRNLVRPPVSCSAAVNGINGCLTYSTCRSRNYYQYSHTTNLQSSPVDQMPLPRKLRKSIQRNAYFLTQKRKFVPHCSSDLSTSCREEVPNYLSINVLQDQSNTKQGAIRKVLVILNPNSGFRSSRDVFYKKVQSTLKLSGFKMEVIETAYAGHAKVLSSTVDLKKFPDGIICVGGDGIVNEVLNGLLSRDDFEVAIRFPIGIIPAGSDNSLVWTVLGIRDPVSAAIALAKGGFTPIDVFAVKWIEAGVTHFGLTASYYGFVADVLQLSENFRMQFGPFRYVVAGLLKFLSLPQYRFEVDYLPASPGRNSELRPLTEKCHEQLSDDGKVRRGTQINGRIEDNWVTRNGEFLGIFVCNHFCKPAQGLLSPVIAPKAQHDDSSLDLILVHGSGRLRLFCFFVAYQLCWHLLLPYVEYVKIKEVKIRPVGNTHNGCGVDGELLHGEGKAEWQCSLLPAQGRLLGQDLGALK